MHVHTVLVVDDNRARCEGIAELLEMNGFVTSTAFDGAEGITLAKSLRPDVLLVDLHMPGMDGIQLIAEIRDDSLMDNVAIVLLTGEAFPGSRYGSDAFLTFPRGDHDSKNSPTWHNFYKAASLLTTLAPLVHPPAPQSWKCMRNDPQDEA